MKEPAYAEGRIVNEATSFESEILALLRQNNKQLTRNEVARRHFRWMRLGTAAEPGFGALLQICLRHKRDRLDVEDQERFLNLVKQALVQEPENF